jgi:hypothetical protein
MIDLDIATLRCSLSQALRVYAYPYFRPMEVDPTNTTTTTSKDVKTKGNVSSMKKARSPSPKSKRQPTATNDGAKKKKNSSIQLTEITSDQQSLSEPIEERQRPALQLQQLNTVIFGLPNLTFTP